MIFASLARAYEHVRIQNVRDFPQTKPDSEITAPFLSNEHGDPRFFFQVFAKKKKSLIVEHEFFLENSSALGVFYPRRELQANHGTVQKSALFPQPGNQKRRK